MLSEPKILRSGTLADFSRVPFLLLRGKNGENTRLVLSDTLEADIQRTSLPSRLLVPENILNGRDITHLSPLICAYTPSHQNQEEEQILDIYDAWIKILLGRRGKENVSVSIFFGDEDKRKSWSRLTKPSWCSDIQFPDSSLSDELNKPNRIKQELRDINIWRHIAFKKDVKEKLENRLYFECTSYHNAFFSYLFSLEPGTFYANYILRQIVEAALLRVLIIDDRIARALWRKNNAELFNELKFQGIYIANRITVDSKKPIILVPEASDGGNAFIGVDWSGDGKVTALSNAPQNGFDILFIHQTIFDDKVQIRDNKEEWIWNTKKSIPYVIFHSGRGKQEAKVPKNASFLEYSVLQEHVLQERSKFFLTLLAMSSRGG